MNVYSVVKESPYPFQYLVAQICEGASRPQRHIAIGIQHTQSALRKRENKQEVSPKWVQDTFLHLLLSDLGPLCADRTQIAIQVLTFQLKRSPQETAWILSLPIESIFTQITSLFRAWEAPSQWNI